MPFSIQFIRGSLAGRRWPLGEEPILVGRSHVCAVRPKEPDVSGRHLELVEAGGVVAVTVLSAHRTVVAGAPAGRDSVLAAPPGSVVELGEELAFRVVDDGADAGETSSLPEQETGTLPGATEGLATAATRFAGDDETGTASLTAATRFAGGDEPATGTLTAATRFADSADAGETSIIGGATPAAGETGESDFGETQVLETQVASHEELEKIKNLYQKRRKRKLALKAFLLGLAAASAVAASVYVSTRPPEKYLSQPDGYDDFELLPHLVPPALTNGFVGSVSLSYPSEKAVVSETDNSVEIRTRIGRNLDVEVVVVADVFEDIGALGKSRIDTLLDYLKQSSELVSALDKMHPLPEEDFFGGDHGIHRGIPCSRVEYWRMRGRDHVYGVISLFRSGTLCCAVRREVPAAEKERASWLLADTRIWLWADDDGAFSAVQWEGAPGAGCSDPSKELFRCEKRIRRDSPDEWPAIEADLRNILVETTLTDGTEDIRTQALKKLSDLRARKVMNWKSLVAQRIPLSDEERTSDEKRAAEIDRTVRKNYPSPDEEWHYLARRENWWE